MTTSEPPSPNPVKRASWWQLAVSDGIPRRSLYVALVVGIILTLINQYDAIPGFGDKSFDTLKAILSFCVPYCVATYGAVTARRAAGE
jgi:hypothetical protein